MNEITTLEPGDIAHVQADSPAMQMQNFISMAVRDPTIDVEKLRVLLGMKRDVDAEAARVEFIQAMSAAQADILPVIRNAENKQTNSFYAKLEHVDASIRPVYTRHGFSLSFDEEPGDGTNMMVVCEVSHKAGHSKKYRLNAPPDTMGPKGTPTKTALHGRGSTITFLRRYLTCNIFNVVLANQDDDGNRGGKRYITAEQKDQIIDLMQQTNTDTVNFLRMLDVRSVDEIESGAFNITLNMLNTKMAKMNKGANP